MRQFIADLRLWQKNAAIAALFVAMTALPGVLLLRSQLGALSAAYGEAAAMAPAGEVLHLVQVTQQHRGLSAMVLAGNEAARAAREGKQAEVDQAIARVEEGDAAAAQAGRLQQRWQVLERGVSAADLAWQQSFDLHTALIADEMRLLEAVAESSGLALDPG